MLKDHNRNTRTRWGISSKLIPEHQNDIIDLDLMSLVPTLHISHVIVELEPLLLTLSRKMFARKPCCESPLP